ncbi:uncharacterized protein LOC113495417 [Trichoplusia ni]|uniref:Uncharacterized protein LOC113495417 n=1 Tax=Trichoplusia ni TaxID=7111 RepID=A0A7E5VNT9_TRINI|nr:uncharacterized protein LOC113495417 [Trichoplusia ni]
MNRIFVIQLTLIPILQITSTYNLPYTPAPPFIDFPVRPGAEYPQNYYQNKIFFMHLGRNATRPPQKKKPSKTAQDVAHDVMDSVKGFGIKVGDGVHNLRTKVGDGVHEIGSKVGSKVQHAWHNTVDWFKHVFG